jgi:hypothetical protein
MAYDYENLVGRYGFVILIVIVFSGLSNLVIGPLSSAFIALC